MDRIHMGLPDTTSTLISQLNYGINETTIMVRVIRAWKSISSYNSDEIVANFILLDEEDNQLLAIAANKERDRVWPNLCEGLAYFIKNFKIVVSPTKWKPIASERSLLFCRGTKIENCCKGHNISTLKFDLRLLSGVQNQHQPDDSLIDVCGVVLQIHDLLYYSNVIENLKLTIMDNSGVALPIILWGRQASMFQVEFKLHRKVNTVLVITGLLVKIKNGFVHLTSTPATILHYNPRYRELKKLPYMVAHMYGQIMCRIPIDTANGHFDTDAPIKKFPGMHQLCLFEPLPQQKVAISKTAIQELLPIANWDGDSCACCSRDVILQQDSYYCTRCNKQYTTIIKRSMRILLADEYGAISEFIIQPREIAQLIGISPLQLVSARSDQIQRQPGLPTVKQINSIKETICSIELQYYNQSTANNNKEYVIKSIIESSNFIKKKTCVYGLERSKRLRTQ